MEFIPLEQENQITKIAEAKENNVIFKHNTTCPISRSVLKQLEQEGKWLEGMPVYFLDLLSYRDLSDAVAEKFDVPHKSPQLLLIKGGKCVYNQSSYNISTEETVEAIEENRNN